MADSSVGVETRKTVLFLCTGNYYRSRFAEELFNHHAERAGLDWTAQSRGLALERGGHNVGPISPFALHALKKLAITARSADRLPQQCTAADLASADVVVAVKEAEHRPLMRQRLRNGNIGSTTGTYMTSRTRHPRKRCSCLRGKYGRSYYG